MFMSLKLGPVRLGQLELEILFFRMIHANQGFQGAGKIGSPEILGESLLQEEDLRRGI
jgi:hypothetical protein